MNSGVQSGWLRERDQEQAEAKPVELFFDQVYVLAVTQLTHHLLDHLSLRGAGQTLLLLLAVCGLSLTGFPRVHPLRFTPYLSMQVSATVLESLTPTAAA